MPRLNGREMCPPSDCAGTDTVARSDGRRAAIAERVDSSGAFWSQILRLCREVRPTGLLPSGVLCLLLYDDVDLSMDEIALATRFNKGHVSRKIRQTRLALARVLSRDGARSLTDQLGDLMTTVTRPPEYRELTDQQWRRLGRVIRQNRHNCRPYDRRRAANAILWRLTTGQRWADLPPRFGSAAAAKRRFRIWQNDGTLARLGPFVCD